MAIIKRPVISSIGNNIMKLEFLHTTGRNVKSTTIMQNRWAISLVVTYTCTI